MENDMTTDNMSNEEVIEVLKGIVFNSFDRTTLKERQALHIAIKLLEERQQGEWIQKEDTPASVYYCCSNCGMEDIPITPFCPWCGAKMKGSTE